MQNKKYFFGLAVLMVAFMGVFGLRSEAGAENCCYSVINGTNQCHSAAIAGNCVASWPSGSCPKCADQMGAEGCCDGQIVDCTYSGCLLPATEGWCCVDDSGSKVTCTDIKPGDSCSKKKKENACSAINDCKTVGSDGWCCINNNGKDKATCTDIARNGTCAKSGVKPTENTCENACKSIAGGCDKGADESPSSGNPSSGTQTSTEFTNPLGFSSIDGVLTSLLGSLKGFVVILAIIFIVIGGIMYMLSAGDPKMVEQAKKSWLYAVIGLAIVVAAPTFLKQVQEILGGTLTGGGIETARSVKDIANGILKFLLSITGIIAIISLVIAGGMYMTAYGEEKQITTAKSIGKWAIVGIVVALGSLTIIQQVSKLITG